MKPTTAAKERSATAISEQNKALVRKVYEIIAGGGFGRAEEVVNPEVADNECSLEERARPKLIDTFERFSAEVRSAFPDVGISVEDMIAEGDRVAARVTMRGTHLGEYEGIAPTGKRVEVRAIDIYRIRDGKIVEHWGHGDDPADLLRMPGR